MISNWENSPGLSCEIFPESQLHPWFNTLPNGCHVGTDNLFSGRRFPNTSDGKTAKLQGQMGLEYVKPDTWQVTLGITLGSSLAGTLPHHPNPLPSGSGTLSQPPELHSSLWCCWRKREHSVGKEDGPRGREAVAEGVVLLTKPWWNQSSRHRPWNINAIVTAQKTRERMGITDRKTPEALDRLYAVATGSQRITAVRKVSEENLKEKCKRTLCFWQSIQLKGVCEREGTGVTFWDGKSCETGTGQLVQ